MLNLGAYINFMPYNIYASLNLSPLKETVVIIKLTNRTNVYPKCVIEDEDVLVQVDEMIFLVDTYILDMSDDSYTIFTPLLLGKPFMK